jgi:hypothetical protein
MKYRALISLLMSLTIFALAACDVIEPAPTLPPPPPLGTSDQPPPIVLEVGTVAVDVRETAVAESSPTPVETPTLAPTATPQTASGDPQSKPVTVGNLPAVSHDLLFIADGTLKRWQSEAQQVVTLMSGGDGVENLGDVIWYSLSQEGSRVVTARLIDFTEKTITQPAHTKIIQTYELSYLDLQTGKQRVLVPTLNSQYLPSFQLSPDGSHLAFFGLGLTSAESLDFSPDMPQQLYVMDTDTGQPPKTLGTCDLNCQDIVWHPDNNFFVYGADGGLWLYNLAASKPELLLSGQTDSSEFSTFYGPQSWAKNGRWLLLWHTDTGSDGLEDAIFDVPTKQIMPIPHTWSYDNNLFAETTWMQDDRLFMVRTEREDGTALGETWRVNVEAGEVQLDESVILSTEIIHPTAPIHWPNGNFGYGLIDEDGLAGTGLYRRVAFNEPAERVNAVPVAYFPPEIAWLPDGSGAALEQQGRLYFAPVGGELYDMQPVVGSGVNLLAWLP